MIHVDRNRTEDGNAIKPSDDWFAKAAELKLLAIQTIQEGDKPKVTAHYKHRQVKMTLEKLFHDKCAYCESSPAATGPWDVEHYRPKGRVAERRKDHPGYYWLAYKWENLFPACQFCNQSRKDAPRYDDPQELPAQGKLDQFPVEDENNRAMSHDADLTLETPLLLNPCLDNPERHLTYDVQGQIHPIDENDRHATETIRICHLRRRRLRDDRARIVIRVRKVMKNLRLAQEKRNELAESMMEDMIMMCVAPDALYSGAARAVHRDPDAFNVDEVA